jgi:hypothetical protein
MKMVNLNDKKFAALVEDNKTAAENQFVTAYTNVIGGIYNSSLPTLANGDYGILRVTSEGKLMTDATLSGDVNVDNTSLSTDGLVGKASGTNADFTTAYASGTTLTCSSLPGGVAAIKADDVVSIQQVATAGSVTNTYTRDDITLVATGTDPTTLTVTGATFAASDTFIVNTNIPRATINDSVYDEDSAHTTGDTGNFTLAVRSDTAASTGDTDGDYVATIQNATGHTWTQELNSTDALTALQIIDDWDEVHDAACGTDGSLIMGIARSSQETAVANDDAVRPVFNLYGEQVFAGYDWSAQNLRVAETDPISSHHVEETLAAITNGADGTYYYYLDMDGFKYFALQATLSGGSGTCTVTVEGTCQDDGTAPASCTYVDVTNDLFGAASFTASDMLIADGVNPFKYVRVKVVASTGAADDADWTLYLKKLY